MSLLSTTFCRPKVCRICCAPDNDDLISVQLVQDGASIAQMFQELTEIQIMADRNLPQNVCLECLDRLKNAYHLRRQCIESDQIFRKQYYAERSDKVQPMIKLEIETLQDLESENEEENGNEIVSILEIKDVLSTCELTADLTSKECNEKERPESTYLNQDNAEYEIIQQSEYYEQIKFSIAQCCGCSDTFQDKDQLLLHAQLVHKTNQNYNNKTDTQYQCPICFSEFFTETTHCAHRSHMDAERFRCRECGLIVDELHQMATHLKQHHSLELDNNSEKEILSDEDKTDFVPVLTLTSFDSNQYKLISTDQDYDIVEFTCFRCCGCESIFEEREQFELHSREMHHPDRKEDDNEMPFECSICYQRFAKKASLAYHRNSPSKRRMVCRVCEGVFKGERSFRKHFMQHHDEVGVNEALERISVSPQSMHVDVRFQQSVIKSEADGCTEQDEPNVNENMHGVEFIDEEDEDSEHDELEKFKPRRINKYLPTRQRKEMGRVPGNLLRVVEALDGYNIVEIMKERCCRCLEFFDTLDELNRHTEEHRKESCVENEISNKPIKYQCEFCLKTFEIALVYVVHKRIREQKQFYQCRLCDFVIDSESRLKNHMLHNEQHAKFFNVIREDVSDRYDAVQLPGVRCCGCGDYFDNDASLLEHSRTVHPRDHNKDGLKRGQICVICDKRCYNKSEVESHQRKNSSTIRYYCKLCEFETPSEARMLKHLYSSIHNQSFPSIEVKNVEVGFGKAGTLRYCCFDRCNMPFCDANKLQDHVNSTHLDKKESNVSASQTTVDIASKWQCDCCYRFFRTATLLKQHQFNQREPRSYVCSICGAAKHNRTALTAHEMKHTGERPYACNVCDKRFASQTILTSHMKCHVPKQYQCNECGEKFARGENLKRHIRHRHSEATFCCNYCPRKLKTREAQVLHERSHTGEKPFACRTEGCEKRYASITDRRRHEMASHTGERPHKCSYCVASFVRKRQLTIHERKHTGERPFVCIRCGKAFIDAPFLKKHSC
ncbi:zinc finger protein 91-like [Sabethes cyaneus]|uniref:zinc finger protein 91-like n=1 Tax=Sabethes cyaneus TaxID=53552 RepID=UPI00237D9FC2|nr:zinc finger protein 91-like [Sabethes cyaneus]